MMLKRPLRIFARSAALIGTTGLIALAGAGMASAHVTAQPSTVAKGSTGEITLRVPDEDAHAGTIKVALTLPLDHPIASVSTKPVPGWTAQTTTTKLDKPVRTDEGAELTEAVRTVTWTADPGTRIEPEQFQEFTFLAEQIPESTDQLLLPATQTYDNGDVVQWDQPPAAPGAPEPEHPAPSVTLVAKTTTQTVTPTSATQSTGGQDAMARWLAGVGLGLAVIGLGVALTSTLRGRRGPSA